MKLPSNVKTRLKQCQRYGFTEKCRTNPVEVAEVRQLNPIVYNRYSIFMERRLSPTTTLQQECVVFRRKDKDKSYGVNMDPRIITQLGAFTTTFTHMRKLLDVLGYLDQSTDIFFDDWVDKYKPLMSGNHLINHYYKTSITYGMRKNVWIAFRDKKLWSEVIIDGSRRVLVNKYLYGGNVAAWYVTENAHMGEKLSVEVHENGADYGL